jgi:hypothetical protein
VKSRFVNVSAYVKIFPKGQDRFLPTEGSPLKTITVLAAKAAGEKRNRLEVNSKVKAEKDKSGFSSDSVATCRTWGMPIVFERQGDSFFRLETLVGKLVEPALNDADFFLVPGRCSSRFRDADRVSADIARRTGFLFENAQAHGQKSGKEKRRRQSENKIPFDFCHELKTFRIFRRISIQYNVRDRLLQPAASQKAFCSNILLTKGLKEYRRPNLVHQARFFGESPIWQRFFQLRVIFL